MAFDSESARAAAERKKELREAAKTKTYSDTQFGLEWKIGKAIPPREQWTVGGQPIAGTPFEHVIPYGNTDQGIAERLARTHARVEMGRDSDTDKRIDQFRDSRAENLEPWESADPMRELADQHVQPGFRGKFLADSVVSRLGKRGWEPVHHANGDLVKLGRLTLAEMPAERAQERGRILLGRSNDQLKEALNQLSEERNKLERDTSGYSPARTGRQDGLLEADSGDVNIESSLRE